MCQKTHQQIRCNINMQITLHNVTYLVWLSFQTAFQYADIQYGALMNNHNDFLGNLCIINKQTSNKYGAFETHWIISFPLVSLLNETMIIINHFKILHIITWAISYCLPYLPDESHILLRLPIFAQFCRTRANMVVKSRYGLQEQIWQAIWNGPCEFLFILNNIKEKRWWVIN